MKLLNKSSEDNHIPNTAIVLKSQYPTIERLLSVYRVDRQEYCALNIDKAVNAPTLVSIIKAYGDDQFVAFLNPHLTMVALEMGEQSLDAVEIATACRLIRGSEKLRMLKLSSLLAFFHRLKTGEFEFFGKLSAYKILQALNKCYPELMTRQYEAQIEAEKAEAKKIEAEKEHITWAEYCKREGVETDDPIKAFFDQMKR